MAARVELRSARIPVLGVIAVHHWFVIEKTADASLDRWEIWQKKNCEAGSMKNGGNTIKSWGHLHKNLMSTESGVGNGGSTLVTQWTGDAAEKLIVLIENSPS